MVDVTHKATTARRAEARGRLKLLPAMRELMARRGEGAEGAEGAEGMSDLLVMARTAGVMAAKRTADLLPLCHPLMIGDITVDFVLDDHSIEVMVTVEAFDRTGVEMEALTACSIAALTLYSGCTALDNAALDNTALNNTALDNTALNNTALDNTALDTSSALVITDVAVWQKSGGRSGSWTLGPDGTVVNHQAL